MVSIQDVGWWFALGCIAIAALAGMALSARSLRNRHANVPCILASVLVLLALLLTDIASAWMRAVPNARGALAVLALLIFTALSSGLMFSILGLAEFARGRRRFRHGLTRAVFSLAAAVGMLGVFGYAVYDGATRHWPALTGVANNAAQAPSPAQFTPQNAVHQPAAAVQPSDSNVASTGDFHSAAYGYSVRLAGTGWKKHSPDDFEPAMAAEFATPHGNPGVFFAVPVHMMGRNPSLEALTQAFLARLNIASPGENIRTQPKIQAGALEGWTLSWERRVGAMTYDQRFQVLAGNGFAWCFAVHFDKKVEGREALMDAVLKRVAFDDPPPRAPQPSRFSPRETKLHAEFFNTLGLHYFKNRQADQSLDYFKTACEFAPDVAAYLQNAADAFIESGKAREGLAFLQSRLGSFREDPKLLIRLASLHGQAGEVDAALQVYEKVFAIGFCDETAFAAHVNLLAQNKRGDEALKALTKHLAQQDSPALRLLQASVLRQQGKLDEAVILLREQQVQHADNREFSIAMAETLLAAARHSESIAECRKLISGGHGTAPIHCLQARNELALKWYREAKTSLEIALQKQPGNADAKTLLTYVSSLLGEGSNSMLKTAIEPVAIPAELLHDRAPADDNTQYLSGYGAVCLRALTAIQFEKNKELKTTEMWTIEVRDQRGVTNFSSFDVSFDPLCEEIYVNALTVRNADGNIVSEGDVANYYTIDDASAAVSQRKVLHIVVPGLQPGCRIELAYTRRDFNPTQLRFVRHTFSNSFPILRSALFVKSNRAALKYEASPGVTETQLAEGTCWSIERPMVYRWEPLQSPETFLPTVAITDAESTWSSEAKEYLKLIEDRLQPNEAVRSLAAQKTRELEKRADKIAALAEFVQKDFTCKAVEFGRRARIPQTTAATLQNRHGDCKDHALLLRQLLESAGLPAELALVSAKTDLRRDLPSLDQFDHMVVFVPGTHEGKTDGGVFIDCTDKDADVLSMSPTGLADKAALILDPENPRFVRIPAYSADGNKVTSERTVTLVNGTDISVRETLTLSGCHGARIRNFLKRMDAANRKPMLQQEFFASTPGIELRELEIEDLDETRAPLVLRMTYALKQKFQSRGDQIVGQIPALWERFFLGIAPVENRQTPFAVLSPIAFQSAITLTPPEGFQAATIESFHQKAPVVSCELTSTVEQAAMKITCEVREPAGRFPSAEYASFQRVTSEMLGALEQKIVFNKSTAN